ncbi:MAG: rhodanese-like domain-containing protein [Planctomycetia bacterium]|nr:rhodanese-like domain-containing protein [Planctomycetia bacterium]
MRFAGLILFGTVALAILLMMGCGRTPDYTDADKRREIEERYVSFKQAFPSVRDVSIQEFVELIERRPPVIVDVRPEEERGVSMIPDAVSKDWFEGHRDQYRDRLVVTYCTIGARSGKYAVTLQQEGFDVANLRGSILAWAHAGRPLVDKDGPTKRVHVFSADWNLLPAGYEAVR